MKLNDHLLDMLFPRYCCHCRRIGSLLCNSCSNQLQYSPQISGATNSLASMSATVRYDEIARSIVKSLKYYSIKQVATLCARLMFLHTSFPQCEMVTAIPLHHKRQAERGHNQSAEIARELARLLSIPYIETMKRNKHTTNLAKSKSKLDRKLLIENQFSLIINEKLLSNKSILIVDDVFTTGATLTEAATVLAKITNSVHAITFAARV